MTYENICGDALLELPKLAARGVVVDACITDPPSMNEKNIIRLYVEEGWTLRQIANEMNSNHHNVARVLARHGVAITRANRRRLPFSDGHRKKIGEATKSRTVWSKGRTMTENFKRNNMRAKLRTSIDLSAYPDYGRLLFLTRLMTKRRAGIGSTDEKRKAFLDRFYFDHQFNAIYDAWLKSGKDKWWYPSLDHKHAACDGGSFDLDNLQFLTWFENRAKAEMSQSHWESFKAATNTRSDLFAESILANPS